MDTCLLKSRHSKAKPLAEAVKGEAEVEGEVVKDPLMDVSSVVQETTGPETVSIKNKGGNGRLTGGGVRKSEEPTAVTN